MRKTFQCLINVNSMTLDHKLKLEIGKYSILILYRIYNIKITTFAFPKIYNIVNTCDERPNYLKKRRLEMRCIGGIMACKLFKNSRYLFCRKMCKHPVQKRKAGSISLNRENAIFNLIIEIQLKRRFLSVGCHFP